MIAMSVVYIIMLGLPHIWQPLTEIDTEPNIIYFWLLQTIIIKITFLMTDLLYVLVNTS